MVRTGNERLYRRMTLLIAVLFAAFTLLLEEGHWHVNPDSSSQIVAAQHLTGPGATCPLCDWLTVSYMAPPLPDAHTVVSTIGLVAPLFVMGISLYTLIVPHRGLRAPPGYSPSVC